MKRSTLLKMYQYPTMIILLIIFVIIDKYFQLELNWLHYIGLFFVSKLIGGYLYTYFSGLTIHKVIYFSNEGEYYQRFKVIVQQRLKNKFYIEGTIDNRLGINEKRLEQYFFNNLTQKNIDPLIVSNKPITLKMSYLGKSINVKLDKIAKISNG